MMFSDKNISSDHIIPISGASPASGAARVEKSSQIAGPGPPSQGGQLSQTLDQARFGASHCLIA